MKIFNSNTFIAVLCTIGVLLLYSCGGGKRETFTSYYFWKTGYKLDSFEKAKLNLANVPQLYLRYFDISINEETQKPYPVSPVRIDKNSIVKPIVPVVFIRNKVFQTLDSATVDTLVNKTYNLLEQINKNAGIKCKALQIDCDWSESTQKLYFYFLKKIRERLDNHENHSSFASLTMLTATIRLHQLKYMERLGVPPVDKGILMLYNMGKIDNSTNNSIYDRATSLNYLPFIRNYTLRLDIALPIFSWGVLLRDGEVITLLNNLDLNDFESNSNVQYLKPNRYKVLSPFFIKGFSLHKDDEIKIEQISDTMLSDMINDIKEYYPNQAQQFIFFDLDSINFTRYDKGFLEKIIATY